jgi:hypothetical protein
MIARLLTQTVVMFKWTKVKTTFLGVTFIYLGTCSSLHKVTRCLHVSSLFHKVWPYMLPKSICNIVDGPNYHNSS